MTPSSCCGAASVCAEGGGVAFERVWPWACFVVRFGLFLVSFVELNLRGGVEGTIVTSAGTSEASSYAMAARQD